MTRFIVVALLFVLPHFVEAAVVINEVAWMGTDRDPNGSYCEWIELFNTGSEAVSLDGWTLVFGNTTLAFDTSAIVEGGAYFLIERYTENACPDPLPQSSDLSVSFGSGLPNTGTTLFLYREDGSLEDQVAGGENWENIGGDNTSKATAQKTTQGWETGNPTPGGPYEDTTPQLEEEDEDAHVTTKSTSGAKPVTIELQLPEVELSLSPLFPEVVYVNQNVVFTVEPKGLGATQLHSLTYEWNFGDLHTSTGKQVTHTYSHPGEYVVTVYGFYGRHEQVARKTIKVLPVTLSVSRTASGDVLIQNNAKYEVNISGFTLQGKEKLTFPPRSIILASGTITIPKEDIAGTLFTPITLRDQKKSIIASSFKTPALVVAAYDAEESVAVPVPISTSSSNFSFKNEVQEAEGIEKEEQLALVSEALPVAQTAPVRTETTPLLALGGIVTVAIVAVLLGRKRNE